MLYCRDGPLELINTTVDSQVVSEGRLGTDELRTLHLALKIAQVMDPAYQLGPDLLAAQKLPSAPVAGMAFGGEGGPDPSKFDIMVGDDFGVWQNKTMESSHEVPVEQSGIPGCAILTSDLHLSRWLRPEDTTRGWRVVYKLLHSDVGFVTLSPTAEWFLLIWTVADATMNTCAPLTLFCFVSMK